MEPLALDARMIDSLWPTTRSAGLSLGDRACLATAHRLGLAAVTADQAWSGMDTGVDIQLIR